MSWIRLSAAFFQNANVIRAGFWGSQVFIAAITMCKLHEWHGGVIPKADFTGRLIARHIGAFEVPDAADLLEEGIQECVQAQLLVDEDDTYRIRQWGKYQRDPTNAERQRRYRERQKEAERYEDEPGNDRNALRNDVTTTVRTRRDKTDKTDRQTVLPDSAGAGGGKSRNGQRLSTKAWACVDGILDELCRGAYNAEWQERARNLRRLRQADALGDDAGRDVLDRFLERFPAAAASGKRKAGV